MGSMKIAIYGAGAIGGHLGAMLSRAGYDVSLIARGPHMEAMRANGLKQIIRDEEFITYPRVTDDPSNLGPQDYVVMSVKSYQAPGVVEAMQTAYSITRRGGTTVTSGLSHHQHKFEISHSQLVIDERTIKGSWMGSSLVREDVPRYISLYKQGKLAVDKLRSGTIGLEELNMGFDKLAAGEVVRQLLVVHDEFAN